MQGIVHLELFVDSNLFLRLLKKISLNSMIVTTIAQTNPTQHTKASDSFVLKYKYNV